MIFGSPYWPKVKKESPHIITTEKLSERLLSMCDLITQSSTLPFLEQFANTVLVDSAKVYFELIEGSGEKGKILT